MLFDNSVLRPWLVYAGCEKALCAPWGASCQLGAVRLSLRAARFLLPCKAVPAMRHRSCKRACRSTQPRWKWNMAPVLGSEALSRRWECTGVPRITGNPAAPDKCFHPKENISRSWLLMQGYLVHLPPGCLSETQSLRKSLGHQTN